MYLYLKYIVIHTCLMVRIIVYGQLCERELHSASTDASV